MIVDSDVLIWYFRGNENAKILLDDEKNISVSAVSYMELFQGARNKCELEALDNFFTKRKISTIQIDKKISAMAIAFVKKFALSHSMQFADALIAATCVKLGEPLCIANQKHYKCVEGLRLVVFKP